MARVRSVVVASVLALAGGACRSASPSPLSYSVERVTASLVSTLDAAEIVLAERGYAIARRDVQQGVLISRPTDASQGMRRGSSARRVAEVRTEPSPEGTRVFCKIAVQQQATEAYQMLQATRTGDDTPGETAIDRDAAGSVAQNTVWRTVSRDKQAEREILAAIAARTSTVPTNY